MATVVRVIIEDKLTPRIKHKLAIYPSIAYPYFIHPSLEIVEEATTPYVPRNSDPPADKGKFASGTLQTGFYESTLNANLYESSGVFGYIAYDTHKGELYAGEQFERDDYFHPKRYPGHKPQFHYLSVGMEVSREAVAQNLAKKYRTFLKRL